MSGAGTVLMGVTGSGSRVVTTTAKVTSGASASGGMVSVAGVNAGVSRGSVDSVPVVGSAVVGMESRAMVSVWEPV